MSKIPVLQVKDKNGNKVPILAIRGPKGEPGKDGKDAPTLYEIGQMIYPVGSVYISVAEKDPADIFGGVWQQLKDRFLLAAGDTYAAGNEGGEAEHTLTIDEMPKHWHSVSGYLQGNYETWAEEKLKENTILHPVPGDSYVSAGITVRKSYALSGDTHRVGEDQPHNNMPPYLAVYMWVRIS